MKLIVTSAALAALMLGAAACTPAENAKRPEATEAAAPGSGSTVVASEGVFPFKIGSLDAIALLDGANPVPNDNQVFGVGRTPEDVAAVLSAADQPTDVMNLSIHPLLIKDGDRTVLIDVGAGAAFGDKAGKLMGNLSAAGVDPASITDVLISHSHPDHIGGLVTAEGALAFPNATIRMSAAEWTFLQANADMAALVTAITPKVQTFAAGAVVAPGITAVSLAGHTPGHTLYEIASGNEKLLYAGDTAHQFVVSLAHPEWEMGYDGDKVAGAKQRQAELAALTASGERVYFHHFPFPGIGHVQKAAQGYVWVPET
ncbi:MAG TPA: MBL fold metallo-hydrolase [Brevundimonas sp.]|jgi:glyoxylase-like metal-dependent hydrolase (beta-lactamase superfamily II)